MNSEILPSNSSAVVGVVSSHPVAGSLPIVISSHPVAISLPVVTSSVTSSLPIVVDSHPAASPDLAVSSNSGRQSAGPSTSPVIIDSDCDDDILQAVLSMSKHSTECTDLTEPRLVNERN